jgi:hypothetical protein
MLKWLKWLTIFGIFGAVWYVAGLYMALNKEDQVRVKQDATVAFKQGFLSGPLAERLKEDLKDKKLRYVDGFMERVKSLFSRSKEKEEKR